MTKLNGVNINGLQLSDLFFNYEKPNYDSVNRMRDGMNETLAEDEREALLNDAKDFAAMVGNQVTPEELMEDFFSRV